MSILVLQSPYLSFSLLNQVYIFLVACLEYWKVDYRQALLVLLLVSYVYCLTSGQIYMIASNANRVSATIAVKNVCICESSIRILLIRPLELNGGINWTNQLIWFQLIQLVVSRLNRWIQFCYHPAVATPPIRLTRCWLRVLYIARYYRRYSYFFLRISPHRSLFQRLYFF